MSGKGLTPQGKDTSKNHPSASKFRTPQNLNSTCLEGRDNSAKFSRPRTGSKFARGVSYSHLDVTGVGSFSRVPAVKPNLTNVNPQVDHELECDLAYNDYLQALLKKEILVKAVKKHKEEMNDQLAVQRDNVFKTKLKCKEAKQELSKLEQLQETTELIKTLSNNFEEFRDLSENVDLKSTLEQLLRLFKWFCSRVGVKNVKLLENEEDFRKLESVLKECITVLQRLDLQGRNQEEVNSLADVMRKYEEQVQQVTEKQKFINNAQENEVFKLFKSLSQMYAKREHYQFSRE